MSRRPGSVWASTGSLARIALVVAGMVILGGSAVTVELGHAGVARPNLADRSTLDASSTVAPALVLAAQVGTSLGLPVPASRTVERVTDTASGQIVDEVTDLDGDGTPLGISRFDASGGLVSVIRLGYVAPDGTAITALAAGPAGSAVAARVGISVAGTPVVALRAAGGWLVRWPRLAGAVPVPGDGVSIQLDGDGSFHAIVRTAHLLAPVPATILDAAGARTLAQARLNTWLPVALRPDATIASIGQAWVAPNDTFGDPIPPGSTAVLHLAWIVRVTMSGSLADTVAGVELAFDAGSGAAIGGDLLE